MNQKDIVLLNTPFLRLAGSHNDRMPLSLCYFSRFLEKEGVSHIVYNGDYSGAQTYWKWKWMFDNFEPFKMAVDGVSNLYGEIIEQIMAFQPKVVLIAAGEPLFATKDLGNPYVGVHFSRLLRKLGVFTIGYGPFYTIQPDKFQDDFNLIWQGEPSPQIIDTLRQAIEERAKGVKKSSGLIKSTGLPDNVLPNLQELYPQSQKTDILMTALGCPFGCAFCPNPKIRNKVKILDIATTIADIKQRKEAKLYLADLNITVDLEHLRNLAKAFKENDIAIFDKNNRIFRSFTVESRVDTLTEEAARLLKEMGVKNCKIGIEGMTEKQLKLFNKKTSPQLNEQAVVLLHKYGIKATGYFMLGGEGITQKDYFVNIEWLKKLNLDYLVVNIWSYDFATDYRYDGHFSPHALKRWKIPKEIFYKYLELQQSFNPTVGDLIGF